MSHNIKDFKKVKSRETKKIKKLLSEEIRLGLHEESNSDAEKVDLTKDLHSLTHYVNKKEKMVEQMFTIISDNSLTKILPPLLKDMNLDELKAECLIHLLGMSSKRIISVLEGREIDSSSESDTHSEGSPPYSSKASIKNIPSSKFVLKQDGCSDISNDSNEFDKGEESSDLETAELRHKEAEGDSKTSKNKKRKSLTQNPGKKKKQTKAQTAVTSDKNESDISIESVEDDGSSENPPAVEGTQGKTLLEILELEMRAKAIRALLKQGSEEHSSNKDDNGKENKSLINSKESVPEKKERIKLARNYRKRSSPSDKTVNSKESGLVTIDLTNEGESSKTKDQDEILEKEEPKAVNVENENMSIDDNNDNENSMKTLTIKSAIIDTVLSNEPTLNETVSPSQPESSITEVSKNTESVDKAAQKSSWAERWLQSKDVNKVVSTSKMCANIRKRMRNARLAKQNSNSSQSSPKEKPDIKKVEGSVTEYQLLNKTQDVIAENNILDETSGVSLEGDNNVTEDSVVDIEITSSKECGTVYLPQNVNVDGSVALHTADDTSTNEEDTSKATEDTLGNDEGSFKPPQDYSRTTEDYPPTVEVVFPTGASNHEK